MDIYAKSRRRLRHIDYVAIIREEDGSYNQVLLLRRGRRLWPLGMSHFSSLDAAKKDSAGIFGTREGDWSQMPDGLIPEPEPAALEAQWRQFDEFQKRPWESDPVVACPGPADSGQIRKYRRLLLGAWGWRRRYGLQFEKDAWRLSFEGEMLIRPMSILKRFYGPYRCSGGTIAFADGSTGSALWIAHLDESKLVLTDGTTFTGNFERG